MVHRHLWMDEWGGMFSGFGQTVILCSCFHAFFHDVIQMQTIDMDSTTVYLLKKNITTILDEK